MRAFVPVLALSVLSACVSKPRQAPTPPPPPAPRPAPVVPVPPVVDWIDRAATPGDWSYARDPRGSIARFGAAGQDALFTLRCDAAARTIYLSRAGAFPPGDSGMMTLRGTVGAKTLPVANNGGTPPYVAASLSPTDPQLDAIAFSRGRFLVQIKGADDLVIPAWAEVGRVIEDCRAGG